MVWVLSKKSHTQIIIEIVSSTFFKVLLTLGGSIFIASLFFGSSWLANLCFKVFLSVGMLRFLLILVLAGSTFADSAFLQKQTNAEVERLSQQEKEFQSAQQEAELSKKERAELNQKLESQLEQKENINQKIKNANKSLQESNENLSAAEAELKEASKGRSALDSINIMKTDPEYQAAKEKQEAAAAKVEKWSERLEELNERLEEKNESIKEIKAVLAGKNEGSFLGEMKKKISGIKNALSLDNLKQTAENFIETSVRLIALFVLKTIVLPLLFLYLGIKGFEKIWKINLPDLLKEKTAAGKEMLTNMRSDKKEDHV